ncbi:integumentary mucin A.1-like [Macrobrachium rosenbergii]|uniref:integumentary mucin A.1-like n=1 Tax=Macrobrachium rosenbergii TaxID=79674 RepID=UPI0034D60FEB
MTGKRYSAASDSAKHARISFINTDIAAAAFAAFAAAAAAVFPSFPPPPPPPPSPPPPPPRLSLSGENVTDIRGRLPPTKTHSPSRVANGESRGTAVGNFSYFTDNCTSIIDCGDCQNANCHWVRCYSDGPFCQKNDVGEGCQLLPCNSSTTTEGPTTTPKPETTTTLAPDTTTTAEPETTTTIQPDTTTEATTTPVPETTTTPPVPETTTTPTPETTTQPPAPETTTTPPVPETTTVTPEPETTTAAPVPETTTATPEPPTTTEAPTTTTAPPTPSGRHFDAASFFGGMVLAIAIVAVAYAAWHFYKSRNGRSYHTLETVC